MKKMKVKRSVKIIIVLIVIIAILFGLYIGFNKIFNNAHKVYINLINNTHDKMISYIEDLEDESINLEKGDIIRETFNVNIQSSLPQVEPYTKYKYGLDMVIDAKNEKLEEVISLNDYNTGKKIFDVGMYMDNETYLMQSKYLYNQTLDLSSGMEEIDMKEMLQDFNDLFEGLDTEDLKYLITSIKESVIDAIDKKTLKSNFDKIKINGKKTNVIRFDYELDKKVLNDVYNEIADSILGNYKLIAILSKLAGLDPDEIEKSINDARDSFTKADSFTISIYKKIFSSEIVRFRLETADEFEIDYFEDVVNIGYQKEKIKIDMTGKNTIFSYVEDGTEIMNLEIKEINAGIIDLDYVFNFDENSFSGEVYLKQKRNLIKANL